MMKTRYFIILSTFVLLASACSSRSAPIVAAPASDAQVPSESNPVGDQISCTPVQGEAVDIATAKLYVEYNATDEDLGVHGAFDDHGYSELCVYDPNGVQVLALKPQNQLQDLTMAGIFFESREPPVDEFNFDDLKANFPEGQYQVRGVNFDGTGLTDAATFSHAIPAPPDIAAPALAEDEEGTKDARA